MWLWAHVSLQQLPSYVVEFPNLSVPEFPCLLFSTSSSMPSRYPPNWTPGEIFLVS